MKLIVGIAAGLVVLLGTAVTVLDPSRKPAPVESSDTPVAVVITRVCDQVYVISFVLADGGAVSLTAEDIERLGEEDVTAAIKVVKAVHVVSVSNFALCGA